MSLNSYRRAIARYNLIAILLKYGPVPKGLSFIGDEYIRVKWPLDECAFPGFCTHSYGYRMCMKVYPHGDGNGKGSHVSICNFCTPSPTLWSCCTLQHCAEMPKLSLALASQHCCLPSASGMYREESSCFGNCTQRFHMS